MNRAKEIINNIKEIMNPGKIDQDAMIKVDDGNGPYDKKYYELIDELKNECGGEDEYKKIIEGNKWKRIIFDVIVNGYKCQIGFMTTHYCGYVVDDRVQNIHEEDIDYEPHGSFTAIWGFDCCHCNDINFVGCIKGYPSKPNNIFMINRNTSSFKTRKYVLNELDKITKSIDRYINKH